MIRFLLFLPFAVFLSHCTDNARPSNSKPPSQAQAAPASTTDSRVKCPEETTQHVDQDLPTHHTQIYCLDRNNREHGPTLTWYSNGTLFTERNYKHGNEDGIQRDWYEDGTIKMEHNSSNGRAQGTYRYWHPNGKLQSQFEVKDDKPFGTGKIWDDQGRLVETIDYEHRDNSGEPIHHPLAPPKADLR